MNDFDLSRSISRKSFAQRDRRKLRVDVGLQYNSSEKVNLTEFLQKFVGKKICKFSHCVFELYLSLQQKKAMKISSFQLKPIISLIDTTFQCYFLFFAERSQKRNEESHVSISKIHQSKIGQESKCHRNPP